MSEISAELVQKLREKTGAGMMDCKKALVEAKGDAASAEVILRKKGIASAGKKASRETKEGVIASYIHFDKSGRADRDQLRNRLRCPQRKIPRLRQRRHPANRRREPPFTSPVKKCPPR